MNAPTATFGIMGEGERRPSSRIPLVSPAPWYYDRARGVVYVMKHSVSGAVVKATIASVDQAAQRALGNGLLIAAAPVMLGRLQEIEASGLLDGARVSPFLRDGVWQTINDALGDTEPALIFRGQ